ncbi:MAG: metallophosphoesterase [Candidatus Diapherotrites archaeon]|nr:metallophosphoesterase [Candidatus Diapherotrites archaeon]
MPEVSILDLCLHVRNPDTLVLSDVQLGYEETLNRQGIFLPRFNYKAIEKRLNERVFSVQDHFSTILVNGDLKHSFGKASDQEWGEVLDLIDLLKSHADTVVLVKGNHDLALQPLAKFKNVALEDPGHYLALQKTFICHGHAIPETREFMEAKTLVIGHDHPAVQLRDGVKNETYKAFLLGKWKDKNLIVMPSFNFLHAGTNILREEFLSPFLKENPLGEFSVWLVEDQAYYFGRVKDLP